MQKSRTSDQCVEVNPKINAPRELSVTTFSFFFFNKHTHTRPSKRPHRHPTTSPPRHFVTTSPQITTPPHHITTHHKITFLLLLPRVTEPSVVGACGDFARQDALPPVLRVTSRWRTLCFVGRFSLRHLDLFCVISFFFFSFVCVYFHVDLQMFRDTYQLISCLVWFRRCRSHLVSRVGVKPSETAPVCR